MTTTATVQTLNINDLKRFSDEARVNMPLITSQDLVTRMNCYEPGQVTPFHVHPRDDEMIFCVEGRGTITFADRSPMPIEQGTQFDGSARALATAVGDPGRVKTAKGRSRRGMMFYQRRGFLVVLRLHARTLGWKRKSFHAFVAPQRFDRAKTRSG